MAADRATADSVHPTRWRVYGATATGATHTSSGRPREDALGVRPPSSLQHAENTVAVAVSDGHGHTRHFRSARGSVLAVEIATRLGMEAAAIVHDLTDADEVNLVWRAKAGHELIASWRAAVEHDVASRPIAAEEWAAGGVAADGSMDQIVYAYGATLILVTAAGPWLLSAQIGDGDLLSISDTGAVGLLVASDPRLDGSRTTSLCQADAVASMRFGVAGAAGSVISAVFMATDGYGNAQARDDWDVAFGRDIAGLSAVRGDDWVGQQLPRWASKCASSEGSGDDVTVALMFVAGARWRPVAAAESAPAPRDAIPDDAEVSTSPDLFGSAARPTGSVRRASPSGRLAVVWLSGFLGAAVVALGVLVYALAR
jgi:Protein phosphatase 2C